MQVGKLVVMGDANNSFLRKEYLVGRTAETFPEMDHGKAIMRSVKSAVTFYNLESDVYKVDHIFRDVSHISSVGSQNDHNN